MGEFFSYIFFNLNYKKYIYGNNEKRNYKKLNI